MRMYKHLLVLMLLGFVYSNTRAQQPVDTLLHKLDSLSVKTDSAGFQKNNIAESAYNSTTRLSFRDYFVLLASNLKQSFTKPAHMTRSDWKKFGLFAGAMVLAGFADEPVQQNALRWRTNNAAVRSTGNYISRFGGQYEVYTLAGFGAYGLLFKNQKVKTTTLLATQAYITGGLVESVLKTLTGRTRPEYYEGIGEAEPTFKGPFAKASATSGKAGNSSFPSGHTTVAFAAATVFAKEYANQPLVPIIAYSAAGLIGVSRITENKHWTTDVLVGAALGYLTGRQVVNNYHRFAKIKAAAKSKGTIAFNMQYQFGKMLPGMVYTFRK